MENGEEDVDLNMAFNLLAMQPSLMSCSKQNWILILVAALKLVG